MSSDSDLPSSASRVPRWSRWRLAPPLLAAVVTLGGLIIWQTARLTDRRMRAELLTQTRMVGQAVNAARVMTLTGSEADLASADYQRLKEQLVLVRSANPDCRFIYLMGRKPDGTIFFFADSEPHASKDYSPPGQTYTEVPAGFLRTFSTGDAVTEGPYTDRWGRWVSGAVPLTDSRTKTRIAVLGMDVDAHDWNWAIAARCVAPALITAFILVLFAVFFLIHHRTVLESQRLAAAASELKQAVTRMRVQVTAMEATTEAILIVDRIGIITWVNPAFTLMTGYAAADIVGQSAAILAPEGQPDAVYQDIQSTLSAGKVWKGELFNRRKDGSLFLEDISITPVCAEDGVVTHQVAVKRDITERRRIETQLRQQQKLAAIGTLARGMAHEINNPIMGIANYAQLIRDRAADNASLAGFADEIIAESERMARMTHSLLNFTQHDNAQEIASATLTDIVAPVWPAVETAARERGIHLSCDISADLPAVVCQKNRIGEVVRALLANAMEAWGEMTPDPASPETMQGRRLDGWDKAIHLTTGRFDKAGQPWVRLTVEDNGPGIPAEILGRAFDPFFTTKDRTRHSGLGLWISRSIVQEHGGEMVLESPSTALRAGAVGQWTRVHVELPLVPEPSEMNRKTLHICR